MRAELGDLEAARALVEDGLHLCGTGRPDRKIHWFLLLQAEIMFNLGHVADAKSALERHGAVEAEGSAISPTDREHHQLLAARIFLQENRGDAAREAIAGISEMVDGEPLSFDARDRLFQRGEVSLDLGDARAALTIAERALGQIASDPEPEYLVRREE